MKKRVKNVTAVVVCSLVLFSMNGCLRANSTEKEISDSTAVTAASTDSSTDSTASGDSTASTEKKDSATSAVDANESKTDTTPAADNKDSANSGDAKAESTDSAAADSTAAESTDSTPANEEAGNNNTDSTTQAANPADATDSANVVGASDIETPNAEGVTLKITTKDGDVDLEQGDKWSVSYDGGAAEDLNMNEVVEINEDTRSVKVTYPSDAVFYTLEVSSSGKGSINSKGVLSGNCYLGTESGSVNFASSAPLEEYNLFVSSSSGKASVNGEDASGPDGYNNIGTTEKMVIVSSNSGDVSLTFNQ